MNSQLSRTTGPSDEQLVYGLLNGDNDSMGLLYSRYYPKVFHKCLAFSRNRDDAFDLTQDIMIKTFSNIHSFQGYSRFSTWLYSIAQNHCISTVSRAKDRVPVAYHKCYDALIPDSDQEDLDTRNRREEIESSLGEYLRKLPEDDRKILVLKYHQKYSIKAIQDELNLSSSAVKMRLMRARQKFREILDGREAA
jgi:RNA polymerase sigma factor (sigma-70 family)